MTSLAEREGRATVIANDPPKREPRVSIAITELGPVSDLVEDGLMHMQVRGEDALSLGRGWPAPRPAPRCWSHALARSLGPRPGAAVGGRARVGP